MKDDRRLLEEGDALERELLHSALADAAPPGTRERLFEELLRHAPLEASGGPEAAGTGTSPVWKSVLLVAMGALAGGGAVQLYHSSTSAPPPQTLIAAPTVEKATPTPTPAAVEAPPMPPPPAREPLRAAPPGPSAPASTLEREVAALDQVRRALPRDPATALRLLKQYRGRFPSGELQPEALALEVEVRLLGGDVDGARRSASSFRARFPESHLRQRVERLLLKGVDR